MKKLMQIFFIIMAAFFLLLCGYVTATEASSAKPQYGGVLKVIYRNCPAVFGYPPKVRGTLDTRPAMDTLLRMDEMGRPQPFLATSWKFGPDRKSLTLTLRKGVKFHDGTDFNAEAVKYNLDIIKAAKSELKTVTSVDVVDEHTVRLNLSQFNNTLLSHLVFSSGLMASPTAIKKHGEKWAMTHPVGTGPFKFVSFKRDSYLKYEKFDGYWDKGKPYLDGLEIIYIKDPLTSLASFQAGEAHWISRRTPKDAVDLKAKGFKIADILFMIKVLVPDSANPNSILANKKVREAVEYAIDRKALAEAFGYGYWEVPNQACPSNRFGYNPDLKGRPYNPEKAKRLLAEAGYPRGFETKIIALVTENKDVMLALQGFLSAIGIKAKLDLAEPGRFYKHAAKGWEGGFMLSGMGADPNYTQTLMRYLPSKAPRFHSLKRPAGWDDLLLHTLAATDFKSQKERCQKAVRFLSDEAMITPIWIDVWIDAMTKSVHGTGACEIHHQFWTPADAWLSK